MSARDIIRNNFWLKSFSLVLAVMIWLAVHYNIRTESTGAQNPSRLPEQDKIACQIMLKTAAIDRQAYVVEPLSVTVKVNADSEALKKLNPNDIQVYVDLSKIENARGAFPVEVKLPRNISLQQVYPSHVHVEPAKPQ
jgi:YbbR domain-containing protein